MEKILSISMTYRCLQKTITAFRKSRYYGVISTGAMRKHRAAEKSLPMTYRLLRIVALFIKCGTMPELVGILSVILTGMGKQTSKALLCPQNIG